MTGSGIAQNIRDFWFADAVSGDADAVEAAFSRWFGGSDGFDNEVERRFGDVIETALAGGFFEWEQDVHSRLALILLLDQFPRNVFRKTARAFAGDARALALSQRTVASGEDDALTPVERFFLLMPYQHAEDLEIQHEGVKQFDRLATLPVSEPVSKLLESGAGYARKHCDIIARFGRFPYRNNVLGRVTTREEQQWLDASGERFGQ